MIRQFGSARKRECAVFSVCVRSEKVLERKRNTAHRSDVLSSDEGKARMKIDGVFAEIVIVEDVELSSMQRMEMCLISVGERGKM